MNLFSTDFHINLITYKSCDFSKLSNWFSKSISLFNVSCRKKWTQHVLMKCEKYDVKLMIKLFQCYQNEIVY